MPLCGQRPLRGPSRMNQKHWEEEEEDKEEMKDEGGGRRGGSRKKTKKHRLVRLKNIGLDLTPIEIRESLLKVARRERNEVTGRVMPRTRAHSLSLAHCCYPLHICARQSRLIEKTVDQELYRRRLTHYYDARYHEMNIAAALLDVAGLFALRDDCRDGNSGIRRHLRRRRRRRTTRELSTAMPRSNCTCVSKPPRKSSLRNEIHKELIEK